MVWWRRERQMMAVVTRTDRFSIRGAPTIVRRPPKKRQRATTLLSLPDALMDWEA